MTSMVVAIPTLGFLMGLVTAVLGVSTKKLNLWCSFYHHLKYILREENLDFCISSVNIGLVKQKL